MQFDPKTFKNQLDDVDLYKRPAELYQMVREENHGYEDKDWVDLSESQKDEWRLLFSFGEFLYDRHQHSPIPTEEGPRTPQSTKN